MNNKLENPNDGIGVALGLVFVSGFVALIYQVLWMKQLGLLFGNTSHAASATLASFFAGLAMGSWFLGRRVSTSTNPMRTYAWLEIGIAGTALLYFVILGLFRMIYPSIYQSVGSGGWLLLIKFALSLLLIFPPAFCMGGTIPVMGQFMIRKRDAFGKTSALMYGVNTLGAATGAALAGFYLPLWLGFNATCALAIVLSVGVAVAALVLSRGPLPATIEPIDPADTPPEIAEETKLPMTRQERRARERQQSRKGKRSQDLSVPAVPDLSPPAGRKAILSLCFLSGFGILALEVLWTRMFSQVLENSVYTFATILVVVLVCLALGALTSSRLARLNAPPLLVLTLLAFVGAGAVAVTPLIFMQVTNGMELIVSKGSWSSYIMLIFGKVALTIGPSALILGMIFPYLMKTEEAHLKSPGLSLGRLATVNTIGAILGALLCGFLLLDWLGMWRSMQVVAILYLMVAIGLPLRWDARSLAAKAACLVALLATILALDPRTLPIISTDPSKKATYEEKILEIWEGSDCTVTVTKDIQDGIAIKINSDYSLGSTGAFMLEKLQADIPLMVYPETESLFFLGVGTGITAGSALDPKHQHVKRVVACELVPEVITAAKKYMTNAPRPYTTENLFFDATGGLFKDPRATVLVEDGRHHLMATDEKFDMINSDLFVPFRSGAGSLYSKEHFESSKKRLTPDGVFVQWLPLYQLTENEFSIIAKTMIETFDQVSMWRQNFQPDREVVALVGHQKGQVLPASNIDSQAEKLDAVFGKSHFDLTRLNLPLNSQTILLFYGGNLTGAKSLFEDYPINTDDRPVIEYQAPRSYRKQNVSENPWFVGASFADFVDKVQKICPTESDPLLAKRSVENRRLPLAGSAFHRAGIEMVKGDAEATQKFWTDFVREWTAGE